MAVVPMQKVRFVVHVSDVDAALDTIQRSGALEFQLTELPEDQGTGLAFPHAQLLPRVLHAVQFLEPYAPKKGLWQSLREGSRIEVSEADVTRRLADTDAVEAIVDDLERLQVEFADVTERMQTLQAAYDRLEAWGALPMKVSDLRTDLTETILLADAQQRPEQSLQTRLEAALAKYDFLYQVTPVDARKLAITVECTADTTAALMSVVGTLGAEVVQLPEVVETPEIELTAVAEELAKVKGELALLHDQAEHFAITHFATLRTAGEILGWQRDRFAILDTGASTAATMVFDGWLDAKKRVEIETQFAEQGLAAQFDEIPFAADEEPPVQIQNSPFVQPFEAVTRLYGMPGYHDLDPTLFLAGFFFLFFGLSLTDVGYGLTLMAVSTMILTLFKVSDGVRMFAKLLLFVGFSTVLVGMLFGGYLGIEPSALPPALQAIQLFDPIANPLPVFYLALGLGVFQVMVGMVLKIYSEARNGRFMNGVLDQGPWLLMFCLGILYLATTLGYVEFLRIEQVTNLLYVGVVLIVLASGRKGDTILQKVQSAALSLYDSIGYFSDILSYSRLLALGLATTALAFAVNLIAEIVSGSVPYLGPILALIVLVIGHVFTLAVNTLGAFIHSARLQFVEFFGKFIGGTGREFAPLARTERYVTVKKE